MAGQKGISDKLPYIEAAGWSGSGLSLAVQYPGLPGKVARDVAWELVALSDAREIASAEIATVPHKDGALMFATLECGAMLEKLSLSEALTATLHVRCHVQGTAYTSEQLDAPDNAVAERFCIGAFANGRGSVVPRMSSACLALALIGEDADVADAKASLKAEGERTPVFATLFLRAVASKDPHGLPAAIAALRENRVATRVSLGAKGRVLCGCNYDGKSIQVDITSLPSAKNATLLNEGCPIEQLSVNEAHEMQFNALYEMISELDEFCQQNGIEYYITGGTLIGALRHKGFIPWDHDIDIYMLDTEFEKLRKLFNEGKGIPGRRIDYADDEPLYPERLGRYVNCETTRFNPGKPRGLAGIGGAGMFIDIFTLAPIAGDTPEQRQGHMFDFIVYEELRNRFERKHSYRPKGFTDRLKVALDIWDAQGYESALAASKQKLDTFRQEGSPVLASRSAGTLSPYGRMLQTSWFDSTERVQLLDHDFSIPSGGRDFLRAVYGVGWRIYPSNRYIPRDKNIYNSVKVPYKLVVDEGLKDVDAAECLDVRSRHKRNLLKDLVMRAPLEEAKSRVMNYDCLRRLRADLQRQGVDLQQCVADQQWDVIDKLFSYYYDQQALGGYGRLRRYVPLTEVEFKAAIYNLLCNRGNLGFACKLVNTRKAEGGELGAIEAEVAGVVESVCDLRDLVEAERIFDARELIADLDRKLPGIVFVRQVKAMLDLDCATADAQVQAIAEKAASWYESEQDPYDLFIIAECHWRLGRRDIASALYQLVRKRSLDGIVLNIIDERLGGGQR